MKKVGILLLAAMVIFVTGAPASAHGPGHPGHGFLGPLLLAPLLLPFAVAATVTVGVANVVGGVASAVTAPFTQPYPAYAPGPVYAPAQTYPPAPAHAPPGYARAPAYPPASVYAPAPAYASAPVYPPAPAYAPAAYAAPRPPMASYRYYCPAARGYYPYVNGCPGGWLTVMAR